MTPTGGFRYRDFNAGCEFNDSPTGWEPGGGLGGKPRRMFQALGGDLRDLPIDAVMRAADKFDGRGKLEARATDADSPTLRFDPMELPAGSVPLREAAGGLWSDAEIAGLEACCAYLATLGDEMDPGHFAWSPRTPHWLTVPFAHWGKTVGWQARDCSPKPSKRFYSKCPPDFVFRQDTVEHKSGRAVIAAEGVVTALSLDCLAVRNASLTRKQESFLRNLGRRVILLPDQEESGLSFVDAAERNGWEVSVPDWDRGVKNGSDAAARYGTLYAVASVVAGASKNYVRARIALKVRGSG